MVINNNVNYWNIYLKRHIKEYKNKNNLIDNDLIDDDFIKSLSERWIEEEEMFIELYESERDIIRIYSGDFNKYLVNNLLRMLENDSKSINKTPINKMIDNIIMIWKEGKENINRIKSYD